MSPRLPWTLLLAWRPSAELQLLLAQQPRLSPAAGQHKTNQQGYLCTIVAFSEGE
jgi:hypothetical protein